MDSWESRITGWRIYHLLDVWLSFTFNSRIYSSIIHSLGRFKSPLLASFLLAADLPRGASFHNILVESPGKMIQPSSHVWIFVFPQRLFIPWIFVVLPRDDIQSHPQQRHQFVSTGIEPKVAEGSLPGNRKTTFKERTGLLLFREGSITKCQQCQIYIQMKL